MDTDILRYTKTSFWQKIALVIFGVFLTVVIFEIGLRLGGFVLLSIQEHRNRISISKRGPYRIMCLGESTTARQHPRFLEEVLNRRNIGIKFSVIDKGVDGTNTESILSRLESNLEERHPNMVITMMGCNDRGVMYYQDIPESDSWLFRHCRVYRFSQIIYMHILKKLKKEDIYRAKSLLPSQGKSPETERSLLKAVELNPKNDRVYVELGDLYRSQSRFFEAEELYKKAIELNPKNEGAYIELGNSYQLQNRFSEAEELYKKVVELNPKNDWAYVELGISCRKKRNFSEAEVLFKKAIELNPKNDWAYVELGNNYRKQRNFSEVEKLYRKALKLNPKNAEVHIELGNYYQDQGKYSEAEKLYKKAVELNPRNDKIYGALGILYIEMGNPGLAREYSKKAEELRLSHQYLITATNYHKLKAILDKKGITYVCVQYPMRSLEPLKKIFQDNAEGIIFVDNEKVFKNALKKASYREYFCDMFGGDFGHCTEKGNRLLAENIANTIIKEVFNK